MFKKKLTKFLTNTFVGKIVDNTLLGGAVSSTVEETVRSAKGEFDYKEVIVNVITNSIPLLLLIAFLMKWVTLEELKQLIKILVP